MSAAVVRRSCENAPKSLLDAAKGLIRPCCDGPYRLAPPPPGVADETGVRLTSPGAPIPRRGGVSREHATTGRQHPLQRRRQAGSDGLCLDPSRYRAGAQGAGGQPPRMTQRAPQSSSGHGSAGVVGMGASLLLGDLPVSLNRPGSACVFRKSPRPFQSSPRKGRPVGLPVSAAGALSLLVDNERDTHPGSAQFIGEGVEGLPSSGRADNHAKHLAETGHLGQEPVCQKLRCCAGLSNSRSVPSAWKSPSDRLMTTHRDNPPHPSLRS